MRRVKYRLKEKWAAPIFYLTIAVLTLIYSYTIR